MKVPAKVIAWATAGAVAVATPFIAGWEGKRNDPYKDIAGIRAVCYGETRVDMRRYSDAECTAMLERAVEGFTANVLKCTPSLAYKPYALAAATSLSYNIGQSAYCNSTVAKRFNAGDYKGGCEGFAAWRMAGGKVVQGLVNRRKAETELCLTGL